MNRVPCLFPIYQLSQVILKLLLAVAKVLVVHEELLLGKRGQVLIALRSKILVQFKKVIKSFPYRIGWFVRLENQP